MIQAIALPILLVLVFAFMLADDMDVADWVVAIGMGLLAASEPVIFVQRRFGQDRNARITRTIYWVVLAIITITALVSRVSGYGDGLSSDRFLRAVGFVGTKVLIAAAVAYCIGMFTKWRLEFAYSEPKK